MLFQLWLWPLGNMISLRGTFSQTALQCMIIQLAFLAPPSNPHRKYCLRVLHWSVDTLPSWDHRLRCYQFCNGSLSTLCSMFCTTMHRHSLPLAALLQNKFTTRSAWVFWQNCMTLVLSCAAPLWCWYPQNLSVGSWQSLLPKNTFKEKRYGTSSRYECARKEVVTVTEEAKRDRKRTCHPVDICRAPAGALQISLDNTLFLSSAKMAHSQPLTLASQLSM